MKLLQLPGGISRDKRDLKDKKEGSVTSVREWTGLPQKSLLSRSRLVLIFLLASPASLVLAANGDPAVKTAATTLNVVLENAPATTTYNLRNIFTITGLTASAAAATPMVFSAKSGSDSATVSISGDTLTVVAQPKLGAATISLTARRTSGSTVTAKSSFTVNVKDVVPPVMSAMPPLEFNFTGVKSTYTLPALTPPTVTDNSGVAGIVPTNNLPPGATFLLTGPVTTATVIWSATDRSGNTSTTNQTITIRGQVTSTTRTETPIAVSGAEIPGVSGVTYADFFQLGLNASAETSFIAKKSDGKLALMTNGKNGRTGTPSVVITEGTVVAPFTSQLNRFDATCLQDNGNVFSLISRVTGPSSVAAAFENGTQIAWGIGSGVLTEGAFYVSSTAAAGRVFYRGTSGNFAYTTVVQQYLPGLTGALMGNIDFSKISGAPGTAYATLAACSDSRTLVIASNGSMPPGLVTTTFAGVTGSSGSSFREFTGVAVAPYASNADTICAIRANLSNGTSGLWSARNFGNPLALVALLGNGAPQGGSYGSTDKFGLDADGNVYFENRLLTTNRRILCRNSTELIREGVAAPGAANFTVTTLRNWSLSKTGRLVVHAEITPSGSTTPKEVLYVATKSTPLSILSMAGEGVTIDGNVKIITGYDVQNPWNNGVSNNVRCINDSGQVAALLKMGTDRAVWVFNALP